MHLVDTLSVLEDDYPEWLHNIIVDVFNIVLERDIVISPHALFQLKP